MLALGFGAAVGFHRRHCRCCRRQRFLLLSPSVFAFFVVLLHQWLAAQVLRGEPPGRPCALRRLRRPRRLGEPQGQLFHRHRGVGPLRALPHHWYVRAKKQACARGAGVCRLHAPLTCPCVLYLISLTRCAFLCTLHNLGAQIAKAHRFSCWCTCGGVGAGVWHASIFVVARIMYARTFVSTRTPRRSDPSARSRLPRALQTTQRNTQRVPILAGCVL